MKKIIFILFILFSFRASAQSLKGRVTDSATHEAISEAIIYIPQLKLGASSDSDGNYIISQIPKGSYDVEIQYVGYSTLMKHITITGAAELDFAMASSSSNIQGVVITALGVQTTNLRSPMPVTLVTHDMLLQSSATNAVDAIATQPGVSEITTGPGISKPEINGLGFNRVLTLMDGERQEDFQWGDEHGIMIDPYAIYNAEIIRGPASLQYGANAMAGVVSFKSEPYAENGTLQGSVLTEYQTNNGLIGTSFDIGGNKNGFVWDIRASNEEAHCYQDPKDGYVWGTAFQQSNVRAVFGINRKWGYSHFSVSFLHRQIEIPDGNRDSAGQFEFDAPINGQLYPTRTNYLSYNPNIAGYQVLNHNTIWWQNCLNLTKGRLIGEIGFSNSQRNEVDTGNVGALNLYVNDIPYSIKYQVEGDNGLKFTTGINGMYEFMNNGAEPPQPYIGDFEIPNYHMFDAGGYGIVEKDYSKLTLSGGVRYDYRTITGDPMYLANYNMPNQALVPAGTQGAYMQFPAFNNSYAGFSGSLGASYQLPEHNYIKLNVAKSFRAPAINELTANELDPANMYKLGDPHLKPEQGYQVDLAYGNNGKDINFEIDAFYNFINNFIFSDRLPAKNGGDSTMLGAPVYQYTANTGVLAGITAYFNVHPSDTRWLEINNGFTYIYSYLPGQTDSTQHIPFTPAPRLTSHARFKLKDKQTSVIRETYFSVGLAKYWAQNNIYSALWNELPSQPYTLYDAGFGTNFVNKHTKRVLCSLFINCTNLLNLAYIDHTSREQYFIAYNGVNGVVSNPSQGIYNMGRNLGIKLLWPIGGHKVSDAELHGVQ